MTNIRIQKFFLLLVTDIFCLTNKETAKDECNNFPRQFHFFLGAIHEKHNLKYLKNTTVKVCIIWCNGVYMYILFCDMFG